MHLLPTKDHRDEEVPRVLQLLLHTAVLRLRCYSARGLYHRPPGRCMPWMSYFSRDDNFNNIIGTSYHGATVGCLFLFYYFYIYFHKYYYCVVFIVIFFL